MRYMTRRCLVVMHVLEEWCHFLEGLKHRFKIWTDHRTSNTSWTTKLNWWQAWWSLYLSFFDLTMHHCPGHTIGKCNALSQCADHGTGTDNVWESSPMDCKKTTDWDWTATAVHKLMVASPSILETKDWSKPDQIKQLQPVLDRF